MTNPENAGVDELASVLRAGRRAEKNRKAAIDCGHFDIRITRDGTWHYRGSPINRKPLVKLFSSVLKRDDDGQFWLETPVEKGRIDVEDAPFTAVEMAVAGRGRDQQLRFRTNLDEWVTAGAERPIQVACDVRTGEPSPYVRVRANLDALIVRPVFYELVELGVENSNDSDHIIGVWSDRRFFPLGSTV